jgi:hypothetical protein
MNSPPEVAVIVPCYNAAAFLTRAIDSVFAQTYSDYLVYAIDDGSTDETGAILRSYGSRIFSVRQTHAVKPLRAITAFACQTARTWLFSTRTTNGCVKSWNVKSMSYGATSKLAWFTLTARQAEPALSQDHISHVSAAHQLVEGSSLSFSTTVMFSLPRSLFVENASMK